MNDQLTRLALRESAKITVAVAIGSTLPTRSDFCEIRSEIGGDPPRGFTDLPNLGRRDVLVEATESIIELVVQAKPSIDALVDPSQDQLQAASVLVENIYFFDVVASGLLRKRCLAASDIRHLWCRPVKGVDRRKYPWVLEDRVDYRPPPSVREIRTAAKKLRAGELSDDERVGIIAFLLNAFHLPNCSARYRVQIIEAVRTDSSRYNGTQRWPGLEEGPAREMVARLREDDLSVSDAIRFLRRSPS